MAWGEAMPLGVARIALISSLARLQDKRGNGKEMRDFEPLPVPREGGGRLMGFAAPFSCPCPSPVRGEGTGSGGLAGSPAGFSLFGLPGQRKFYVPAVIGLAALNPVRLGGTYWVAFVCFSEIKSVQQPWVKAEPRGSPAWECREQDSSLSPILIHLSSGRLIALPPCLSLSLSLSLSLNFL